MRGKWKRVRKNEPCPVCGKADWCLISSDGSAVICPRVESHKRIREAGYLHILRETKKQRYPSRITIKPKVNPKDLIQHSHKFQARAESLGKIESLSKTLGVSTESLRRLGIGWDQSQSCWTFPLADADGRIVGLNRRFVDGSKYVYPGHRAGLYLPMDLPDDMQNMNLLVCEGGSDTAAALDLEFWAVGRFSCTHGRSLLRKLITLRKPARIVIVADGDDPGQRGSERLACHLIPYVQELKIITPPAKDLRVWLRDGVDYSELDQIIRKTNPIKLVLTTKDVRHGC